MPKSPSSLPIHDEQSDEESLLTGELPIATSAWVNPHPLEGADAIRVSAAIRRRTGRVSGDSTALIREDRDR